jgi:hypothetical protein
MISTKTTIVYKDYKLLQKESTNNKDVIIEVIAWYGKVFGIWLCQFII